MKKYLKIEFLYIIIVLAHEPLFTFVLKIDGAGRSILAFTFIILFFLIKKGFFLGIALKKPIIIWGIWAIYAFINSRYNGYDDDRMPVYTVFLILTLPVILMTLIVSLYKEDYSKLLNVMICGMYLGILVMLVFNRSAAFEDGRYGGKMNSNTIGIMNVVLLMFIYLKYLLGRMSIRFTVLISILPIILILITGSKTAFGGLFLLILIHFIVNRSKYAIKNIVYFSLTAVILYVSINLVINFTVLGERISETTDSGEELGYDTGNDFLDKFGDRGIFYYLGWKIFKEYPIYGIGLGKFIFFSEIEQVQHSEYMIQLTELGLIGFSLFFLFHYSIFTKLAQKKVNLQNRKLKETYFAYLIVLLLMITATRMYNQWYLFSIIGLVIGFIQYENKYKVIKTIQS